MEAPWMNHNLSRRLGRCLAVPTVRFQNNMHAAKEIEKERLLLKISNFCILHVRFDSCFMVAVE